MPKTHRGALRSHSRSSSTSKLSSNLQFTQKEQHQPKLLDKPKKNGATNDNILPHVRGIARVASAQGVHSREHTASHLGPKQRNATPLPPHNHNHKSKIKAGFTVSTPGEEGDEDEWVSSSGAATPDNHQSSPQDESDDASDEEQPAYRPIAGEQPQQTTWPTKNGARSEAPALPRIQTPRPSDFRSTTEDAANFEAHKGSRTPTLPPIKTNPQPTMHNVQASNYYPSDSGPSQNYSPQEILSPATPYSRSVSKRQGSTRPSSSHSMRSDYALRPHPLIRGHSYGQGVSSKPAPLQPLTSIQDSSTASVQDKVINGGMSTSPSSSIQTDITSPGGLKRGSPSTHRRASVSSARSVATLPVQPGLRDSVNWSFSDRKRTLSTMSHSSSSAALSSLTHLPTFTRPPSPQSIAFFPPVNPHANIEGIHPLLPGPYLSNHLTVLARRTPIKESFDRVIRAKQVRP